ncbi:MAG: hypothetical protein D6732_25335 [Methanobacteriota archaeon]|nr:MAG: hypothetical protein D6732_25335 [Euryarchaeota archaeon]
MNGKLLTNRHRPWTIVFWFVLIGLATWSYGFNAIPLVGPIPLAEALIAYMVLVTLPIWWRLQKFNNYTKKYLRFCVFFSTIVIVRLFIDVPKYGFLAIRDAVSALYVWAIFPAIAVGYFMGTRKVNRYLDLFYWITTIWFMMYPWRGKIEQISPQVGITHPVPLFAFRTTAFVGVASFFWFFLASKNKARYIGAAMNIIALLFAESRGGYLSLLISGLLIIVLHPEVLPKWTKTGVFTAIIFMLIFPWLASLPGRHGVSPGVSTVVQQLGTLAGNEGPGAGSFQGRLTRWPNAVRKVLLKPGGPVFGIGLGEDLFGLVIEGGILVRKPHNDFLETWARLGLVGFLPFLGLLLTLTVMAIKISRYRLEWSWVLALQVSFLVRAFTQNAFGFAYTSVVYLSLLGVMSGALLRDFGLMRYPKKERSRDGAPHVVSW